MGNHQPLAHPGVLDPHSQHTGGDVCKLHKLQEYSSRPVQGEPSGPILNIRKIPCACTAGSSRSNTVHPSMNNLDNVYPDQANQGHQHPVGYGRPGDYYSPPGKTPSRGIQDPYRAPCEHCVENRRRFSGECRAYHILRRVGSDMNNVGGRFSPLQFSQN